MILVDRKLSAVSEAILAAKWTDPSCSQLQRPLPVGIAGGPISAAFRPPQSRLLAGEVASAWASVHQQPASIDRLEEKGLVIRGLKKGDRRAFSLTLSPKGEQAAVSIEAIEGQAVERLLRSLSEEERELVGRAMELVIAADGALPESLCLHCGDAHNAGCIIERLTE